MINSVLKYVWYVLGAGALGILLLGGYRCGQRSRNDEVGVLLAKASESERTVELKQGLYATAMVEMDDVKRLLGGKDLELVELKRQLDATSARVITTERVVVRWKTAYESQTTATQTAVPSATVGSPERKRVDFRHDFGPFLVIGHTLTDPPEGFVSVSQGRPLSLTLAVAKNRDGTWASYVTSSEPGMAIAVTLGAVDPGILRPSWYQRLWVKSAVSASPGQAGFVGVEYAGDRISLGPQCQVWSGGWGCGLSFGIRMFR